MSDLLDLREFERALRLVKKFPVLPTRRVPKPQRWECLGQGTIELPIHRRRRHVSRRST